jgi:hypothetical protein
VNAAARAAVSANNFLETAVPSMIPAVMTVTVRHHR